jgi:parvulin-like peptidyl-prolyl isomerase
MALMERMRGYTKALLILLVFAFVGTIIFDWGMDYVGLKQKANVIATVNGMDISIDEFNRAYQFEIETYRQRAGADPEESQLDFLRDQVYESLVRRTLLQQEIEARGLNATDAEIIHYIYNDPPDILKQDKTFQNEQGQFDLGRYKQALANPSADWRPVEEYLRGNLPFQKFQEELSLSVIVTESQVMREYEKRYQKAKVRYLFVDPNRFGNAPLTVSSDEVEKYYDEHLEEFNEPEKRTLDYLLYSNKATLADSQNTQKLAQDLAQRARNGEDFSELAKTYSEDPGSRERGGDLGFFGKGSMVKPFEDAAFGGKPGEIVGPVVSTHGLHVIKIHEFKTEKEKNEETVHASHFLLKYQASPQTIEAAKDSANLFVATVTESGWEAALAHEKMKPQTTTQFTEGSGFIPGVGVNRPASRFAFNNPVAKVSEVFETAQGFLVVRVAGLQEARTKELSEVRADTENIIKGEKRKELAQALAAKLRAEIDQGMTLDAIAARDTLQLREAEPFTRTGFVSGVGRDVEFIGTTFSLQPSLISKPVKGMRGSYLIQLLSIEPIDMNDFAVKKESLRTQLIERAQQSAFTEWYEAVKEKAKIKDYRKLYFN